MPGGGRNLYALAQWGRSHPELAQSRGFTSLPSPPALPQNPARIIVTPPQPPLPPGVAPLPPVFRRWDGVAFAAALSRWAVAALPAGSSVLAVDGKALLGLHGDELPGARLVAAYAVAAGLVVGQKGVSGSLKPASWGPGGNCWPAWIWPAR